MKELHPGTKNIGFLVENYVYSLMPRSKIANLGQNASKLLFAWENQGKDNIYETLSKTKNSREVPADHR
jgi:hypothetical protein